MGSMLLIAGAIVLTLWGMLLLLVVQSVSLIRGAWSGLVALNARG